MTAPAIIGLSLFALATVWLVVSCVVVGARPERPRPPLPRRTPRLDSEWDRITAAQMQARADIAANADLAEWEREMSA